MALLLARARPTIPTATKSLWALRGLSSLPDYSKDYSLESEIADANDRLSGLVEISHIDDMKGYGVVASKPFERGELVMVSKSLKEYTTRDSHSIQIDWNKHAYVDLPARFVNHSCDANVGIQGNDFGAYNFIAIKDIDEGQEVLWDYETAEYEISTKFDCTCGAPNCRGVLKGYKYHGDIVLGLYGEDYIADYLKELPKRQP